MERHSADVQTPRLIYKLMYLFIFAVFLFAVIAHILAERAKRQARRALEAEGIRDEDISLIIQGVGRFQNMSAGQRLDILSLYRRTRGRG